MVVYADPNHPLACSNPFWIDKFRTFKKTLVPKLKGLPENENDRRAIISTMNHFLDLSVEFPRTAPRADAFVSKSYARFLDDVPYIHKAEVQDFISNGVHLRTPSPRPPLILSKQLQKKLTQQL